MKDVSKNKAWVVLWSATAASFISGILYVWSVISKGLISELGWTSTQASLPYTTVTICFVIGMVVFGRIQDTKGPRLCVTIAGLLMGGGLILSGFAKEPWMMVITFGIITGTGIGITNVSASPPAMKWFPPGKKGMITGIVVGGVGLAPVLFSPASNFLIEAVGMFNTLIIFGLFALAVVLGVARNVVNPPPGYDPSIAFAESKSVKNTLEKDESESSREQDREEQNREGRNKVEMTRKEMLKTANFYKLWFMLAFSASAGLMIIGHAANIAVVQIGWQGGYLLVILLSIFNALGRLLGGTISDKIGRVNMMRFIFGLQALNMLLFSSYKSVPVLAVGIAVAGFCYGGTFSVFPATTADLYGLKNFGANYGTLFTAWGFGGIIGPMTAARILDSTNSYNAAYIVAFVLLLIALAITFTFNKKKKPGLQQTRASI